MKRAKRYYGVDAPISTGPHPDQLDNDNLKAFLILVPTARWKETPSIWWPQARLALNDDLIKIGFGGVWELTDAGRAKRDEI